MTSIDNLLFYMRLYIIQFNSNAYSKHIRTLHEGDIITILHKEESFEVRSNVNNKRFKLNAERSLRELIPTYWLDRIQSVQIIFGSFIEVEFIDPLWKDSMLVTIKL